LQKGNIYKKLFFLIFKFVIENMKVKNLFIIDNFITFTFMKLNKSTISLIMLAIISIILIIGSPFQITNDLVKSNGHLYIKNIGQEVYAQDDGGAPLYEDELTKDEKDYYEEYKPEKEEPPNL
jgi:hypothetical protein